MLFRIIYWENVNLISSASHFSLVFGDKKRSCKVLLEIECDCLQASTVLLNHLIQQLSNYAQVVLRVSRGHSVIKD